MHNCIRCPHSWSWWTGWSSGLEQPDRPTAEEHTCQFPFPRGIWGWVIDLSNGATYLRSWDLSSKHFFAPSVCSVMNLSIRLDFDTVLMHQESYTYSLILIHIFLLFPDILNTEEQRPSWKEQGNSHSSSSQKEYTSHWVPADWLLLCLLNIVHQKTNKEQVYQPHMGEQVTTG